MTVSVSLAGALPCPSCSSATRRLDIFADSGVWLWSRCEVCGEAWGWPDPQLSFFDAPAPPSPAAKETL